jgi:hypothetical protein
MTFFRHVPILQADREQTGHSQLNDGSPPQHVTLFRLLQDQDQLVDPIDFVLDALDQRPKSVGDVIDQGVGDPVRGDRDVVLERLDTSADVLRVWCSSEVELENRLAIAHA